MGVMACTGLRPCSTGVTDALDGLHDLDGDLFEIFTCRTNHDLDHHLDHL